MKMMNPFERTQSRVKPLTPVHAVALISLGLFSLLSIRSGVFVPMPMILGVSMAFIAYLTHFILTHFRMGDTYISSIVSLLFTIGLAMQYRLSPETGFKQFVWFLIGTSVFLISSAFFHSLYKKMRSLWLIYGTILALFVLTLAIGSEINGAKNWIIIGGLSMQPSEFIKILFVFFMAEYIAFPEVLSLTYKTHSISSKWVLMGLVFLLMGLFVIQREFGTALLIFMVYLSFLYVFEREILFPIGNALIAGVGAVIATQLVHHLQVRVDTWLDPWADISGKGYQITQSLFAIGSGGFFGTGLGLGHPKYIPNVASDFIFSAICEETGIFGGIAIILLFLLLVYRGVKLSLRLKDRFTKALAFGLTVTLGFQTFIIIGGVIKLIPLTGITLPFVSYGGSSLIASYLTLSILQALSGSILREEVSSHEDVLQQ